MTDASAHVPQHAPTPRELDDVELLAHGVLGSPGRFTGPGGGITLTLPPDTVDEASRAGTVELVDPEGVPLARVMIESTYDAGGRLGIEGPLTALGHNEYGAFRRLYLSPEESRAQTGKDALTVPVTSPLTEEDLAAIAKEADGREVVLLALTGTGTPSHQDRPLSGTGLIRATLAAAGLLDRATVVAVPLAADDSGRPRPDVRNSVVAAYAPGQVLEPRGQGRLPAQVAEIVAFELPPRDRQGLVLFFTGLSGSGKSTLARALHDVVLERGKRTVTSLDGDVVRRNLSAGLTFSKADRETNIRRIGWVAAEISRHGGVAICSPIAPFDETRRAVRGMVQAAGGAFFLIHVATPVEECERRDRKGLYAKARRGEIPEFTGISSPYDEPEDADVRVDTTGRTIEAALDDILTALDVSGYLPKDRA